MFRNRRIVVKVGTSILTSKNGQFSKEQVERVSSEILDVLKEGCRAVLVSSGAIACGMDVIGMKVRPKELPGLQACAAIGQGKLMKIYEDFFSRRKFHTAQVLLTRDGIQEHARYLNARNTLNALLRMSVLPVVNENDTVATEEIRFGDNDTLSALVSSLVDADLLIILSDVDGFYVEGKNRLETVRSLAEIDGNLRSHVYKNERARTTGGMETKLEAARFAMQAGVPMIIASGREPGVLHRILSGEKLGTLFLAGEKKRQSRKNWLAFSHPQGTIRIDDGARKALVDQGRSLLPSGILSVDGNFDLGDAVRVLDSGGKEIARGLVNYNAEQTARIKGLKTDQIRETLGYKDFDEVIHRDNLVVTSGD
jgi:glutamate 5-kinase